MAKWELNALIVFGAETVPVVKVSPLFEYSNDGTKTKQIGYTYFVLNPKCFFETEKVKVLAETPVVEQDTLDACNKTMNFAQIRFENFVAKPYRDKLNKEQLSCKADKAILVNHSK
ncbi:MAG: hypothetical protein K0Q87_407 [Neobacillus sp.]|jgi:hypothetical protein|nr:hypothetical protein [Neobacillus sp.]